MVLPIMKLVDYKWGANIINSSVSLMKGYIVKQCGFAHTCALSFVK